MKQRCYYKKSKCFGRYGGRGITVCTRWLGPEGYANFLEDMGRMPAPGYTVERKDSNGNYEPLNCRWATRLEQSQNRSGNRIVVIDGRSKCVAQWCREYGISPGCVRGRLQRGIDIISAIRAPIERYFRVATAASTAPTTTPPTTA